ARELGGVHFVVVGRRALAGRFTAPLAVVGDGLGAAVAFPALAFDADAGGLGFLGMRVAAVQALLRRELGGAFVVAHGHRVGLRPGDFVFGRRLEERVLVQHLLD